MQDVGGGGRRRKVVINIVAGVRMCARLCGILLPAYLIGLCLVMFQNSCMQLGASVVSIMYHIALKQTVVFCTACACMFSVPIHCNKCSESGHLVSSRHLPPNPLAIL